MAGNLHRINRCRRHEPFIGFVGCQLVGEGGLVPKRAQQVDTPVSGTGSHQVTQLIQCIPGQSEVWIRFKGTFTGFEASW